MRGGCCETEIILRTNVIDQNIIAMTDCAPNRPFEETERFVMVVSQKENFSVRILRVD
jgi:hypothetical protein